MSSPMPDIPEAEWEVIALLHEIDYLKSLLAEARDALLRPRPSSLPRLFERIEAAVGMRREEN